MKLPKLIFIEEFVGQGTEHGRQSRGEAGSCLVKQIPESVELDPGRLLHMARQAEAWSMTETS